MIWIVLGAIIGIAGFIKMSWDGSMFDELPSKIIGTILAFPCGIICGGAGGFLVGCLFSLAFIKTDLKETTIETIPVYSLEDNIGTKGHFSLGYGSVESTDYIYYVRDTKHGLKIEKQRQDYCYIQKQSVKEPYVKVIDRKYPYKIMELVGVNFYFNRYEFYVPKDTIKVKYNIDLQ